MDNLENKKKVCLIPLKYDEYNYGGVLQFFALQKALIQNNVDCKILFIKAEKNICVNYGFIKSCCFFLLKKINKMKIRQIKLERAIKNRKKKIEIFKRKYYTDTVFYKEENLRSYNAIICGSDQIWNPNFARERAFLTFAPNDVNTIIYAASMGCTSLTEEQKMAYKGRVERIKHVSVRESSSKKILDDFITGKDIEIVADPTLLLDSDTWKQMCEGKQVVNDKYIFTYFLGAYSNIKDKIEKFAQQKKLRIVNIPFASGESFDSENFGDIKILAADPIEFLSLIRNAEYIFTDSFHACVFSIIFEKNFFVFKRDGKNTMLGRIDTLLEHFNLTNRLVLGDSFNMPEIDYTGRAALQNHLREKSLQFLISGINNE